MIKAPVAAFLLAGSLAQAAAPSLDIKRECARMHSVYPRLMLATMLEGPVDCGTTESESVDCAAGETAAEKAAHARRFAIRQKQEAAYKTADDACTAWDRAKTPATTEAASAAITSARATGEGQP